MGRKLWIIALILMSVSPAMTQNRGTGVFPSYVVENPQRYGEGIFSHIIKSDNFYLLYKGEILITGIYFSIKFLKNQ